MFEGGGCPGRELWDVLGLVVQRAGDLGDQVEDGLVDETRRLEDEGVEVCVDGFAGSKVFGDFVFLGCCCCRPCCLRRVADCAEVGGVGDADVVDGLVASAVCAGLGDVPSEDRVVLQRGLNGGGDVRGAEHLRDLFDHPGMACTCPTPCRWRRRSLEAESGSCVFEWESEQFGFVHSGTGPLSVGSPMRSRTAARKSSSGMKRLAELGAA